MADQVIRGHHDLVDSYLSFDKMLFFLCLYPGRLVPSYSTLFFGFPLFIFLIRKELCVSFGNACERDSTPVWDIESAGRKRDNVFTIHLIVSFGIIRRGGDEGTLS